MKHVHPFSFLLLSAVTIATSLFATGCQQDPSSPPTPLEKPETVSTASAHPALTWSGAKIINGATYSAIYVADTNLGNLASVHVASLSWSAGGFGAVPNWSPNGSSICFIQKGAAATTVPDTIKAIDVTVNGSTVSGSNLRAILGLSDRSIRITNAIWSSTSTMGNLAYTTREGTTNSLRIISQSGGTPTTIYSVDNAWARDTASLWMPAWNSDDSRLAVTRVSNHDSTTTIMIFNTSTWAYVDSITVSGKIFGLEWSRSGTLNKLAYGVLASGSTHYYLYYCTPTTGSTPTTNGVEGNYPSWSPNNISVLYTNGYTHYLNKNVPQTASTSTVGSFGGNGMKWKR